MAGTSPLKSTVPVRTADTLDRVFLAQSTRPRRLEVGAGRAAEFYYIVGGKTVAQHADGRNIVIVKSTVPVRIAVTLGSVFLAQSTPPKTRGVGAGRAADLKIQRAPPPRDQGTGRVQDPDPRRERGEAHPAGLNL